MFSFVIHQHNGQSRHLLFTESDLSVQVIISCFVNQRHYHSISDGQIFYIMCTLLSEAIFYLSFALLRLKVSFVCVEWQKAKKNFATFFVGVRIGIKRDRNACNPFIESLKQFSFRFFYIYHLTQTFAIRLSVNLSELEMRF